MMSLLALMWICWVPQQSAAETRKLYGYVTDVNNEPLVGVSVRVYRTSYVTVTDAKGRYQLGGDWARGATILFTYIGYKPQKLQDDGRERMDVKMEEAATGIGEVVVKAKSNINAIDLRSKAGIVENVDIKRLNEKPMIDLGLALQGMIPGLNVINQGELGTAPQIRIRGNSSFRRGNVSNEPLYVLDGKIISAETFYNLNPQDIASIKVLKDAAAGALYGIKAANGVLEISSQHGYQGKMIINYGLDLGLTLRGRRGVRLMDTEEKLELERLLLHPAIVTVAIIMSAIMPPIPIKRNLLPRGSNACLSLERCTQTGLKSSSITISIKSIISVLRAETAQRPIISRATTSIKVGE